MWDKPQVLLWVANLLYAFAAILLLYAVLFLVIHLPLFPFREIQVNGDLQHVTREQVEYVVTHKLKGNFFTLDLKAARAAFEKLPWVRTVNVRRRWPGRLEVTLEEHVALARWGTAGLVNTKGELFYAASNANLPVFIGETGDEKEIAEHYLAFKAQLAPLKLVPVQVSLSARRAWEIKLNDGLVVELGREQTESRLAKFVSVYDRTVAQMPGPVRYVDLRYPNGFAIQVPQEKGLEPARTHGRNLLNKAA